MTDDLMMPGGMTKLQLDNEQIQEEEHKLRLFANEMNMHLLIPVLCLFALGVKGSGLDIVDECVHLTEENFDDLVMDPLRNVLVYFYAPWCDHCKRLEPQYKVTCTAFSTDPLVTISMVDGTEAPALRERYKITGYPKLLMFSEISSSNSVKEPVLYTGPRKHRDILEFVNEQAGTYRHVNGSLGSDAALVPVLDTIVTTTNKFDEDFLGVLESAIRSLEQSTGHIKQAQQQAFKLYRTYAQKTVEKGEQYPQHEVQRLTRLIENPLTKKAKAEEFQMKLNVVSKFLGPDYAQYSGKTHLVKVLDRMISEAPALDNAFAAAVEATASQLNVDTTHYVMYAKKIAGNGVQYIDKELKRLGGLLASNNILKHKKRNLQARFDVLRQFQQLRRENETIDGTNVKSDL